MPIRSRAQEEEQSESKAASTNLFASLMICFMVLVRDVFRHVYETFFVPMRLIKRPALSVSVFRIRQHLPVEWYLLVKHSTVVYRVYRIQVIV